MRLGSTAMFSVGSLGSAPQSGPRPARGHCFLTEQCFDGITRASSRAQSGVVLQPLHGGNREGWLSATAAYLFARRAAFPYFLWAWRSQLARLPPRFFLQALSAAASCCARVLALGQPVTLMGVF
jgi:hypothetical protein